MRWIVALLLVLCQTAAFADYNAVIIADAPIHYYHLNDTDGTARDVSTNPCGIGLTNGSYLGGYTQSVAGIPGFSTNKATSFNGTTGHVDIGLQSAGFNLPTWTGGFSVEAWAKGTTSGVEQRLITSDDSAVPSFEYELGITATNHVLWVIYQSDSNCGGTAYARSNNLGAWTTGAWHYFVGTATFTATQVFVNMKVYLDGSLLGTVTTTAGTNYCTDDDTSHLASRSNGLFFAGTVDEPAWYRTCNPSGGTGALSQAQVTAHYNAGIIVGKHAWPFTVRWQDNLPQFRDDNFWAVARDLGYDTGLFEPKTGLTPILFGYMPYSMTPNGNTGSETFRAWHVH